MTPMMAILPAAGGNSIEAPAAPDVSQPLKNDLEAWDELQTVLVHIAELPPQARDVIRRAQVTLEGTVPPRVACRRQARCRRGWGWRLPVGLRRQRFANGEVLDAPVTRPPTSCAEVWGELRTLMAGIIGVGDQWWWRDALREG